MNDQWHDRWGRLECEDVKFVDTVRDVKCCSKCISEKDSKRMWDIIYGLMDGNQCSNWAGNGGGLIRSFENIILLHHPCYSYVTSQTTGQPDSRPNRLVGWVKQVRTPSQFTAKWPQRGSPNSSTQQKMNWVTYLAVNWLGVRTYFTPLEKIKLQWLASNNAYCWPNIH